MSEQTTRRFRTAIVREIASWDQEGLIAHETADMLIKRYPVVAQSSRTVTILLIVGVVLVGLGMLLFVCANWEHMARINKVAVLVGSTLASYVGAWHCKYEPGKSPKLGSALLLLGALLYGASIWLISQIFNFDTSLSTGLFAWAVGTAAMTMVTKSRPLAILLALLVPAWNLSLAGWTAEGFFGFHIQPSPIMAFIASTLAAGWICAACRSRAALYVLLIGGLIWSLTVSGAEWAAAITYGAFLFAAHLSIREKSELFAEPLLYGGTISALIGCFVSTFDKSSIATMHIDLTNLGIMLGVTMIPCIGLAMRGKTHQSELIGCMGFAIAGAAIAQFTGDLVKVDLCNIMFISLMAALMAAGMRLQRAALVNVAIVFVVIDIIARYFDMFFSTMDRSMFFVFGGLILICAGAIAERNRRKFVGSFS